MEKLLRILRSKLIQEKCKNKCANKIQKTVVFSTTYSPQFNKVSSIIEKHLPILYTHENVKNILGEGVKCICRRAPTIGTKLSPSLFNKILV